MSGAGGSAGGGGGSINFGPGFDFTTTLHDQPRNVQEAHRWLWYAIRDLQNAIPAVQRQFAAAPAASTAAASSSTSTASSASSTNFPGIGRVNDQSAAAVYTTQASDNGIWILLGTTSPPPTVNLGTVIIPPWFCMIANGSTTTAATLTAGGSVLINGSAAYTLPAGAICFVEFQSGAFYVESPRTLGFSGTVHIPALTPSGSPPGTPGSITFVNGLCTAAVNPT